MDLPPSTYLLLALFFSLFLFPQHSISHTTVKSNFISPHEFIKQCLIGHSIPPDLLFFPQSENFTTAFLSPFQNERIILDNHTTKPLLLVTPTHESHAQATVLCSRKLNLQIRTRSGGHDNEGLSYTSTLGPFLMLDLQNLRSISFDLHDFQNTAWVQSGATLGELYFAIASKSKTLAFSAGYNPTIGVGGHISGGGVGTITRAHGISADNVIDIRIINADGQILQRKSMGEDLFWALKGGGGSSFGVILAYKIKLVKVPPKVTVFSKSLTLSQGAIKALSQWQQIAYRADNRLHIGATLNMENKTMQATIRSLFLGEMTELLSIMKAILPEVPVFAKDCKEVSWIESLVIFSPFPLPDVNARNLSVLLDRTPAATSISFKVKSDIVTEPIAEQSWAEIWQYIIKGDEQHVMLIEPLGGKVAEIAETETPFPHRNGSKFLIQYILLWPEAGEEVATKHINWLKGFYKFMTPYVSKNPRAAYLNSRDLDLGKNMEGMMTYKEAQVWGTKYYKANFERLTHAKSKTDPENYFKNEQSIPPLL